MIFNGINFKVIDKERKERASISYQSGLCKKKILSHEHQNIRIIVGFLQEYHLHTTRGSSLPRGKGKITWQNQIP